MIRYIVKSFADMLKLHAPEIGLIVIMLFVGAFSGYLIGRSLIV